MNEKEKTTITTKRPPVDHRVEITEVNGEFFVAVDGIALTRPNCPNELPRQAKFTSARNAFRAAEMKIRRDQKGFLV